MSTSYDELPSFEEVHVISDIHMGGQPGFQILRETQRLASFIEHLRTRIPEKELALVFNGDVIDTLAEKINGHVATSDAVRVVSRIMDDPAFKGIWDALAKFVKTPSRTLVFVLGNHDIEMAFPPVQRLIVKTLAGADAAARGRIQFCTIGDGFACTVGGRRVYCTHGNEVDAWNFNRYEEISKISRRLNAGQAIAQSELTPNAGTRMVKEFMNQVKETYAWIDLLKPEEEAAAAVMLAIVPGQKSRLLETLAVYAKMKKDGWTEVNGRLAATAAMAGSVPTAPMPEQLLSASPRRPVPETAAGAAADIDPYLVAVTGQKASSGAGMGADGTLGIFQTLWDDVVNSLSSTILGTDPQENLRTTLLQRLAGDKTFLTSTRDETFDLMQKRVGDSVDFLITGHTHLKRAFEMGPQRYYFNTGTWIRLLELTPESLSPEEFPAVYEVLSSTQDSLKKIDDLVLKKSGKPFVKEDCCTSVCVGVERNQEQTFVVGSLHHVEADGTPQLEQSFRVRV